MSSDLVLSISPSAAATGLALLRGTQIGEAYFSISTVAYRYSKMFNTTKNPSAYVNFRANLFADFKKRHGVDAHVQRTDGRHELHKYLFMNFATWLSRDFKDELLNNMAANAFDTLVVSNTLANTEVVASSKQVVVLGSRVAALERAVHDEKAKTTQAEAAEIAAVAAKVAAEKAVEEEKKARAFAEKAKKAADEATAKKTELAEKCLAGWRQEIDNYNTVNAELSERAKEIQALSTEKTTAVGEAERLKQQLATEAKERQTLVDQNATLLAEVAMAKERLQDAADMYKKGYDQYIELETKWKAAEAKLKAKQSAGDQTVADQPHEWEEEKKTLTEELQQSKRELEECKALSQQFQTDKEASEAKLKAHRRQVLRLEFLEEETNATRKRMLETAEAEDVADFLNKKQKQ
jgi:hypothetical protein